MNDSDERRNPVEFLAEEFVERCRRGEHPTVAEYAEAHPVLAEQIREVFPTLLALEELKSDRDLCAGLSGQRAAESEEPPSRLGDFRIVRTIGRGGMGVVYEAEQESLGRRVAIKVLAAFYASSPRALQRFRREAQAAAQLHHTNIVSVFGVGEHEGKHFYVMQYIEGRSLDHVVAELSGRNSERPSLFRSSALGEGERTKSADDDFGAAVARAMLRGKFEPISRPPAMAATGNSPRPEGDSRESSPGSDSLRPFSEPASGPRSFGAPDGFNAAESFGSTYWRSVAGIGTQVATALHYAHRQGILHRDIKPGNLILDENGVAWITDFGLAKLVDQEDLTHPGDVVGTLRYMAPEQLEGETSARSDVYSLGLTLYELLTLRPAFNETSRYRLLRQVSQQEPPRPRTLNPDIPRDLETVVLKAVARDPVHRYETAGELADDLQRFLQDRPIRSRRTSPLEHGWRWCRRNPALAFLTTTTLLLLLAGVIGSSAGYVRESRLRARAESESQRAEANLAIAAEAFEDVFSQVSGVPLSRAFEKTGDVWIGDVGTPAVGEKDALVLEGLLKFYDQFAEQNRGNTRWQRESGQAYRRVGDIQQRLGRFREAEEAYGRAIEIFEHLAQSVPGEAEYLIELATVHNQLGSMALVADRFDEAFRQYELAGKNLTGDTPMRPLPSQGRFELAKAYRAMGLAVFLRQAMSSAPAGPAADAPDAEACLRKALAIFSELAAEAPSRGEYRHALAECYGNLWGACHFGERPTEAAEARRQAIGILEELTAEFPKNPQYRQTLALTYAVTSDFSLTEESEDSVAWLRKALALMEEVPAPYTEVPDHRRTLAHIYQSLAEALFESGQDERVERPRQTSQELFAALTDEFPDIPHYRAGLGRSYYLRAVLESERGQPEVARQTLKQVLQVVGLIETPVSERSPLVVLLAKTYTGLADLEARRGESALADQAASQAEKLWEIKRKGPFKTPDGRSRDPWGADRQLKQPRGGDDQDARIGGARQFY